ncbi:serine/arginine repetitive matrix protein 2-like isoform X2 [Haliotis rubra]|uniref:serine/arginine repetitive matrix protein 2-like isoform X2 n=1 Tax=Haliotis rubra TaxID=36100 RepID=UPI001EE53953|nr:serine/arginine repetitive matrix protein 2-like isoform X2 [Haliotis rubra]
MGESTQEWSKITPEERIQHETLFYSQGPLDGYLTAERARDVFLKSGLPLQVLSQIWNLADVSNDNLLNVHEFVLAMHLTLGTLEALKLPVPLPRYLTPPTSEVLSEPLADSEKEAYKKIFKLLDKTNSGFIEADMAQEVFSLSGLPPDQLGRIWDIADVNRDGSLDPEEWMVACHLIRTVKKGLSIDCPVNVFAYLPDRISPNSLQARKRRVDEYEVKKHRLMVLKEKRKQDVSRESRRLQFGEVKLKICRDLYHLLKKSGQSPISAEQFKTKVAHENGEITKQEEIVHRLKKEHERVRQSTVKIILEEQRLNEDIRSLKSGTTELNKKLRAIHTKATKDPDPFHQLYEQKKEKKITLADLDAGEIYIPFTFDPFNKKESSQKVTSGARIFQNCDNKNNNHKLKSEIPEKVIVSFKNIDDSFTDIWGTSSSKMSSSEEEDPLFKTVTPSSLEADSWFSLHLAGDSVMSDDSKNFADLQRRLVDLKNEMQKLNMEGDRLVFRNPEEYTARKRAKEEEERAEKLRHQRRGGSGKENIKRHSYTSKPDEAVQAAREYRIKRRSLHLEGKSETGTESPTVVRRPLESPRQSPRQTHRSKISSESKVFVEQDLGQSETTSTSPLVVEKLDLSSVGNNQEEAEGKHKSPERALKENNTQETKSSGEKTPREQSEAILQKAHSSSSTPVKSLPRSSSKKSRAPPPPQTSTSPGPTSPRSPSTTESPVRSPEVLTPTSATVKPPIATKPSVPIGDRPPPVAPPRLKKKRASTNSNSSEESVQKVNGLVSSKDSSPTKSEPTSPRVEEIVQSPQDISSFKAVSKTPESPAKRPTDLGITSTASLAESKEKPLILESSLESEIFGALNSSKLFKDTDAFASNSDSATTVATSTVTQVHEQKGRLKSPETVTVVTREGRISQSSNIDTSFTTEGASQLPQNSELFGRFDAYSGGHGGARPKVKQEKSKKETVKQEALKQEKSKKETVKQEALKEKSKKESIRQEALKQKTSKKESVRQEALRQERTVDEQKGEREEEEIETIIEEVIEIKTALDNAGNPILDSSAPGYTSEIISTKKTVMTQVIEPKVSIEESVTEVQFQANSDIKDKVKSPKRKAPAPPVAGTSSINQVHTNISNIEASPSSTPPSVRVSNGSKRSSMLDHLAGTAAAGYESDASDASSVPPPLPDSAPPPLPTIAPPLATQPSGEEIVEIDFKSSSLLNSKSSPTGNAMMEKLIDFESHDSPASTNEGEGRQVKSLAQMRADFFGLDKPSPINLDDNETFNSSIDAYFPDIQRLDSSVRKESEESEDEGGFNATFSPGDSGILVSSLPTSPDETDSSGIQLISFQNQMYSKGDNSSDRDSSFVRTSVDSAFEDSMISPTSSYRYESKGGNQRFQKTENDDRYGQAQSGVISPRGKMYDSEEMVEKARQFAETVQKPNFVVKRDSSTPDDFDQQRLQALELERRAIISQATVRMKFGPGVSSPTEEGAPPFYEDSESGTNPNIENHWELVDNPNQNPDIGWTGRPDKVNLYSENVVQEADTTEEVNRESIRDLSSTRHQWETILSPVAEKSESRKKSTVRHWEVNFPNKRKSVSIEADQVDASLTNMEDTQDKYANESAIEREIRLNMEREETLRREQEERKLLREKGKVDTTIYESVPKDDETKPMFHELTEADRGSEMWKRETIIQQELREQEEKERALRKNKHVENSGQESRANGEAEETKESIIEKEIRIQREREAELQRQRKGKTADEPASPAEPEQNQKQAEPQNDINHNQTKSVSYEKAISGYNHEGESLIARELREAREREEELQHQRSRLNQVSDVATPAKQQQQQSQPTSASKTTPKVSNSSPAARQGTWQKDVSPFLQKSKRSGSVDSLASSHSTGKSPTDLGAHNQEEDEFSYKPQSETPIEREIRLARERENELRRSKGLPDLPDPKAEQRSGPPPSLSMSPPEHSPRYFRSPVENNNTMKRYSSNRLQQEIIKQKQREMDLRKEGKIITTSEEHIQPLKYVAVTGQETTNANVKKNFVTRKSSAGYTPTKSDEVDSAANVSQTKTTPKAELLKSRKVMSAGGAGFSYKESRNTAESKIERELREMREREDELRKQRATPGDEKEPNSPREATPNGKSDGEQASNKKGNVAAQWEQMCNN